MDHHPQDEWDEWGEEDVASSPQASPRRQPVAYPVGNAPPTSIAASSGSKMVEKGAMQASEPRAVLDWMWDLDGIDADLMALAPSTTWSIEGKTGDELLCRLAVLAQPTRSQLQVLGATAKALRAQAYVTQWSLQQLQRSLQPEEETTADEDSTASIHEELLLVAGDWAKDPSMDTDGTTTQQLEEMSSLLQHALLACDEDDVSPFQQAIEQLFTSLPDQSLTVPTSWIRPPAATDNGVPPTPSPSFDAYLQRLVTLCDGDAHFPSERLPVLTEAQTFQDTKDIQRDELVVNGEAIAGAVGYDVIIAKIEAHIRSAVASFSPPADQDPALQEAIRNVAKQTLNACNRTESGGCSYEILSQFISQHSMEHVLIRPASARAPPLEIVFDLGPFMTQQDTWSFGLRARVSAVTWYCICDANDPTHEFYEVETTYANRLAFPLGLSPLSSKTMMRRDVGAVTITLKLPEGETMVDDAWASEPVAHSNDGHANGDVDLDSLM